MACLTVVGHARIIALKSGHGDGAIVRIEFSYQETVGALIQENLPMLCPRVVKGCAPEE